uniref:Putative VRR-NUC domain-containing protein n=1 Tax=viral metagenome TaxID=1070528 RepID=A0A6H2A3E5_9ZZZZ
MTKQLKNAETQLRELLEKDGWRVTHKGWPDFACVRDGEMMFVEVKGYRGEMLRKEQHFILTNLAKLGLDCFKWTPDVGFQEITPTTPLPTKSSNNPIRRKLTDVERWNRLTPEQQEYAEKMKTEGKPYYY